MARRRDDARGVCTSCSWMFLGVPFKMVGRVVVRMHVSEFLEQGVQCIKCELLTTTIYNQSLTTDTAPIRWKLYSIEFSVRIT